MTSRAIISRVLDRLYRKGEPGARERRRRAAAVCEPITVVVPMAGLGARFDGSRFQRRTGAPLPKPLLDVCGRELLWWALQSLRGLPIARLVFVVLRRHQREASIGDRACELAAEALAHHPAASAPTVVELPRLLPGPLASVLAARDHMERERGLLIAGADTLVVSDLVLDLADLHADAGGLISVKELPGDRWSFVRVDDRSQVVEVAEKRRISDLCATGLYYFSSSRLFLEAAEEAVRTGDRVGGEYYVAPAYNLLTRERAVRVSRARMVWDMGTPKALEEFIAWAESSA